MNKNEFIEKVDKEILPAIREQLLEAYGVGYEEGKKEVTLEEYLQSHNLEKRHLVDLGLPSGTVWINIYKELSFVEAQKLGLQFPTFDQVAEFKKCMIKKMPFASGIGGVVDVVGLNSKACRVANKKAALCLWNNMASLSDDFEVSGYVLSYEDAEYRYKSVFGGERYYTLFVLPEGVK
jgi:hypothetical protein